MKVRRRAQEIEANVEQRGETLFVSDGRNRRGDHDVLIHLVLL